MNLKFSIAPRSVPTAGTVLTVLWLAAAGLAWAAPASAANADPTAGKAVFRSNCAICHSVEPDQNKIGPSLFGVVGRTTAAEPGYHYSSADKNAHITWSAQTLDTYLVAPRAMIPGTKMTYGGLKDPEKRADLIAYLETLK
jgi:cytochrome c